MAQVKERWEDNAPGSWYVDRSCILCGLCAELAPSHFRESDDGDHDVVYQQPMFDTEIEHATKAKEQCPVDAIDNNGLMQTENSELVL